MSRYTTVRELAAFLHCEALAMLWSYFDESGTHHDARVTCIAGYVGTPEEWTHVENQWQQILDPYAALGLTCWHSSDVPGKPGVFERIDTQTKQSIKNALLKVIKESDLQVIWNGIDTADFTAHVVPHLGNRTMKPYDLCFYWIIRQLEIWRIRRGVNRIGMMFGIQTEYNKRSEAALKSWQRFNMIDALDPISFGSPKNNPALQPADMLGNEMYRCWLRVANGTDKTFVVSDALRDLSRNGLTEGGFATEESLKVALTADAWLNPSFNVVSE